MIALLHGEVALRRADHVVLLCGGVGYKAAVSTETLRRLPAVGGEATLHTHLIARDDALALFGFHSEQERDLFLMLLSVQAVGPKLAMAILSAGSPPDLLAAIAAGDATRFRSVPGIGKRTAERIIVELREKAAVDPDLAAQAPARRTDDPSSLAAEALQELGYSGAEVRRLLESAQGQTAEELLAQALREARVKPAAAATSSQRGG